MINIQPRTREQREAQRDKDLIEKTRIDQRVGYEARGLGVGNLIHQAPPQSSLYVPENERFDKDFAIADKRQREMQLQQKEQVIEKKRIEGLDRETKKWEYQEKQEQKDQQKLINHTQALTQGKRNQNGLAYNPITLQYDKTQQGNILKEQDDQAKVRQYVRAQNLDQRGNAGFNILTGESRNGVDSIVPNHLKNQYQQKLRDHEQNLNIKTHSQFNN
ncbi:unnamed protein product (macronuclear) [Paramecium tetraurelia]|uniref:Uncharacterized protein n=1 Tax=Paramecium tetraurelia TaxID=5888 RepID=A0DW66_PARTE|nr:uncharacterized protein GSPATT00020936001 [Paramecium tetraurelia]CAK87283.1 unnamed protein product [Paramecium tetraurelia]|eukprot:XP_001454680.1 hypothetical protein (macronuclear) [Paramecium tetraurelia strain d4-2]